MHIPNTKSFKQRYIQNLYVSLEWVFSLTLDFSILGFKSKTDIEPSINKMAATIGNDSVNYIDFVKWNNTDIASIEAIVEIRP